MQLWQILATFLLLGALSGCSGRPDPVSAPATVAKPQVGTESEAKRFEQLPLSQQRLLTMQREWHGVPYRLGGMSKRGVDCSGFVSLTYRRLSDIMLPRTVEEQRKLGFAVKKSQLKVGDLLFFKTGWSSRHVGIYIGNNEFMHASTSQGVMISSLDNSYWKQKYWQARRLL
ncbi:NlpC/P60 family protein [Shewanella chilikensis]|jgi:lipoprotein Spr|uniref:Peptidase P60 n=1 Tax=Shewanella chilikensis TaxID=558541 RepID=A0A6G7LXH0_9GAMM|nr:peptidase P60 [Shewanella chilikensis]